MSDEQTPTPSAPSPAAEPAPPAPPAAPPADTLTDAATAKPRRRRKGLIIAGSIVGGLLIILVGLFLYLLQPPAQTEFNDPVDANTRSTNAALYAALIAAGIQDPFVDTNEARAYVAYTLPNASLAQADTFQRFVIGSAADASPSSEYVYAFQYVDASPHQLWIVKMVDFRAYIDGTLTSEDFEGKIEKVAY